MKSLTFLLFFLLPYVVFSQHNHQNHSITNRNGAPLTAFQKLQYNVDLHNVTFDLNLERNSRNIAGSVTYAFEVLKNTDTLAFELHQNFKIDSVVISSNSLSKILITSILRKGNEMYFVLPKILKANPNYASIKIAYRGDAPGNINDWGEGIVQKIDPTYGSQVLYSLTCPYFGHQWFPCKQVLSDKLDSSTMNITTSADNIAVSNGVLKNQTTLPNGKKRFEWSSNYPINYYLISFIVTNYIEYPTAVTLPNGKSMPINNYLLSQKALNDKKAILDNVGNLLNNYSKLFGIYPFAGEKFGTAQVPLSGGMEHQTCVNLSSTYDKYLVAHEMAHQWWGDNVSVSTLQDVWLSEGFATYSEYLTAEKLYPTEATAMLNTMHNQAFVNTRTFTDDTSSFQKIYEYGRVYARGAVILHTLRFEVNNDKMFFDALAKYQDTYKGKAVNVPIFKAFMEKEFKMDLTRYFDQWYYGYGYPKFTTTWNNVSNQLIIKNIEATSSTKTALFKTPFEIKISRTNMTDTTIRVFQGQNTEIFVIPNMQNVTTISIDPSNWILNKMTSLTKDINLTVTDTKDILEGKTSIFPNPNTGIFTIKNEIWNDYRLEILDANGRLVRKFPHASESENIDLSNVAKGVYFVRMSKNNIQHSEKIVLEK